VASYDHTLSLHDALPILAKEGSIKRVLILGLGGGSSIPPLRYFFDPQEIVAVEMDEFHLEVARDHFKVTEMGVQTHCADAVEWRSEEHTSELQSRFELVC